MFKEHTNLEQKALPQLRQWCFRSVSEKRVPQAGAAHTPTKPSSLNVAPMVVADVTSEPEPPLPQPGTDQAKMRPLASPTRTERWSREIARAMSGSGAVSDRSKAVCTVRSALRVSWRRHFTWTVWRNNVDFRTEIIHHPIWDQAFARCKWSTPYLNYSSPVPSSVWITDLE